MSVLDLMDLREHLNVTDSSNDGELQDILDAAETAISHYVGGLGETEVVEKHDGGSTLLILRRPPVLEVTEVTYADGTELDLDDLDVDLDTGIVHWRYSTAGRFTAGSRYVTVTYTTGREDLPADLRMAILVLAGHLWETQRGAGPVRAASAFGGALTDETPVPGLGYALPHRVMELLAPYRLGPVIA